MDRIPVVDDDPLILQALSRVLCSEGYEVICHSDPRCALEERSFEVVLADFMMPHLTGIELLASVARFNPDAVRILLTSSTELMIASEAVARRDVFRVLSKPWTRAELTSCVRQAVEHHRLVRENQRLRLALSAKDDDLRSLHRQVDRLAADRATGVLEGMISALDYRDTEMHWHSRRVSLFARRLAEAHGAAADELDIIEQGALLHDVGKIGVRDAILHKPGPLSPEEWEEMKLHPEYGFRLLSRVPYLYPAALIVLQHHEHFDGSGYPNGLRGNEIVFGARVFSIVDTLDAVTSDRPHRLASPILIAKDEIRRGMGTQFDPDLCETFLSIAEDDWRNIDREVQALERDNPFAPSPFAVGVRKKDSAAMSG